MGDQHLRILLEHRRDRDRRNVLFDRIEGLECVRAQVKIDLSHWQEEAIVDLRTARDDGDVEPISAVRAVGQRLVKSAMLGLRDPVGSKGQLVERLPQGSVAGEHVAGHSADDYETRGGENPGGSPEGRLAKRVCWKSRVWKSRALHGFVLPKRVRNIREPDRN